MSGGSSVEWSDPRYTAHDTERLVAEPPKRVVAPERTPFERDRARVVHAASIRRLAGKTQVVGPFADDFGRNRLTHSLEVAQVARDLSRALGSQPDLAETAALAHDLGHPPFGHNGERVLADLAADIGGFEGNAQTFRLLTRLEAKAVDARGESVGLNLTRAALDACTKYPWGADEAAASGGKFGVFAVDQGAFAWMRTAPEGADDREHRRCVEAQIMDLADDVAYSVHDVEDGVVAGRIDLAAIAAGVENDALFVTARAWYLPDTDDATLKGVLDDLARIGTWPSAGYRGRREDLARLKNLTSDLIGRFCGEVRNATREARPDAAFVRYGADLVVPERTHAEIALLKSIAAHYVMETVDRRNAQVRQEELLRELFDALEQAGSTALDPMFSADFEAASDDAVRRRVLIDQLASLTDASAVHKHRLLCRRT